MPSRLLLLRVFSTFVLGLLSLFFVVAPAKAAIVTVFDSIDGGCNSGDLWINSARVRAQAFTVGAQGGLITKLTLEDAYSNPFTSGYYVGIYSDNSGQIGSRLVTFESSPQHINWTRYLEFDPLSSYSLEAATTYWVVADMSYNNFYWNYENSAVTTGEIPSTGYRAYSADGANFSYDSNVTSNCYGTGSWHYNFKLIVDTAGDTTPPTISSVSSNKANGSYKAGEVIDIDVTFSEPVTSTGNVTVTLETGDTDRSCTFSVSNSSNGTCNYTVQAGDVSADLTTVQISGTIKDQNNNAMSNYSPAVNLAANKALVIDTSPPGIPSASPVGSTFNTTQTVTLSSTGSSSIYFTTNGDAPTTGSTIYSTGISVSSDTTLKALAVDAASNESAVMTQNYVFDVTAPVVSDVANSPSSTSSIFTWTTNEESSSQVEFGLTSSYGITTSQTDTSPRVTSHSVIVNNLLSCKRYYFRVKSQDLATNQVASSQDSFVTTGCPLTSIGSGTETNITTVSGGEFQLPNNSSVAKLTIPDGFAGEDAAFQINKLSTNIATVPDGTSLVDENIFDLSAVTVSNTDLTTFDKTISFTVSYGSTTEGTFEESTLDVYRYNTDASSWDDKDCVLDMAANTLTCSLTTFSTYAVFGREKAVSVVSGGGFSPPVVPSCADYPPTTAPILFRIDSTKTSAQLFFVPVSFMSKYFFSYSTDENAQEHGVMQELGYFGVQKFVINDLLPSSKYFFKVRSQHGCQPGPWSSVASVRTKDFEYQSKPLNVNSAHQQPFANKLNILGDNTQNEVQPSNRNQQPSIRGFFKWLGEWIKRLNN